MRSRSGLGYAEASRSKASFPIELHHPYYGKRWLYCEGNPEPLFTENETNNRRLFGADNASSHVKDGINDYVVMARRKR